MYDGNRDQVMMYYPNKERTGLHMVAVEMNMIDASSGAADVENKLESYINITTTNWLGWKVGHH